MQKIVCLVLYTAFLSNLLCTNMLDNTNFAAIQTMMYCIIVVGLSLVFRPC